MTQLNFQNLFATFPIDHPPIDSLSTTSQQILKLLQAQSWDDEQYKTYNALARNVDVTYKLSSTDSIAPSSPASCWGLFSCVIFKSLLLERDQKKPYGLLLKRINTLMKALDQSNEEWIQEETDLRTAIDSVVKILLTPKNLHSQPPPTIESPQESNPSTELQTIPLTVLFYEGPIARAYLETIRSMGLRPQKIINLIAKKDLITKKEVGRFLFGSLKRSYASNIQRSRITYWPNHLTKEFPQIKSTIFEEISDKFTFDQETLTRAQAIRPLSEYSNQVEDILVAGLRDPILCEKLKEESPAVLLYTGGGIVPETVLNIAGLRFLHIHPGHLPAIRGGDCTLWSTLLHTTSSASCFYMDAGIDTGDIILPCWLPKVHFSLHDVEPDPKILYRSIFSFFDPWVRAFVLREVPQDPQTI